MLMEELGDFLNGGAGGEDVVDEEEPFSGDERGSGKGEGIVDGFRALWGFEGVQKRGVLAAVHGAD